MIKGVETFTNYLEEEKKKITKIKFISKSAWYILLKWVCGNLPQHLFSIY